MREVPCLFSGRWRRDRRWIVVTPAPLNNSCINSWVWNAREPNRQNLVDEVIGTSSWGQECASWDALWTPIPPKPTVSVAWNQADSQERSIFKTSPSYVIIQFINCDNKPRGEDSVSKTDATYPFGQWQNALCLFLPRFLKTSFRILLFSL